MNIAVNPSNSNKSKDGTKVGDDLYVDYIRFQYSSKITLISVNGVQAGLSGTTANATIESEYRGMPKIDIVGEVSTKHTILFMEMKIVDNV